MNEMTSEALANVDRATEALQGVAERAPNLRALISSNEKLREEAERVDRGHASLAGRVIVIKDNIDTIDLPTTCGSFALDRTARDADLVVRLRRAGVLTLGKANLSEWSHFRAHRAPRGWSARGGLTQNPFVLDRTAGGSSSGSAALVAAGVVDLAIGTETDASIVEPAAFCGVVGLKPTVGRISQDGIVPISHTMDTAGPITRTVRDAGILLDVISTTMRDERGETTATFATSSAASARGMRVGLLSRDYWTERVPGLDEFVDAVIEVLGASGADIVDELTVPNLDILGQSGLQSLVQKSEFGPDLAAYLAGRGTPGSRSLEDLIRFNNEHPELEMAHFGQEAWLSCLDAPSTESAEYKEAVARIVELGGAHGIDAALRDAAADVLIAPFFGLPWKADVDGGVPSRVSWAADPLTAASTAGYPVMTVPIGSRYGLPVGMTILGTAWSERKMLAVAASIERGLDLYLRPGFLTTVPEEAPASVRDYSE
ncbi:MAG: amidase family protein [Rhizobiaceae bacterium]|nr:amidase family protein [Rhizobiaceae bacterium]